MGDTWAEAVTYWRENESHVIYSGTPEQIDRMRADNFAAIDELERLYVATR